MIKNGSLYKDKTNKIYMLVPTTGNEEIPEDVFVLETPEGSVFGVDRPVFDKLVVIEPNKVGRTILNMRTRMRQLDELIYKPKRLSRLRLDALLKPNPEILGKSKNLNKLGVKDDSGKPDMRLVTQYFPRALEAIGQQSTLGAIKYTVGGWRSVPDGFNRYTSAMLRHHLQETTDEDGIDKELDMHHAVAVAWNAMARLELLLSEVKDADSKD